MLFFSKQLKVLFCQEKLLNYFAAGVRQVINLVNQNKDHARKHIAILQVLTT